MKTIILGIICSFLNFFPINIHKHTLILNNIFNTNIFINNLIYLTPFCLITILIPLKKIKIKKSITKLKLLIPIIPILLIKFFLKNINYNIKIIIITNFIFLIILSITFIKKTKKKEINYIKIFLINLLSLLPGSSFIYTYYISIKDYDINNKFKQCLIPFIIESLFYIKPIQFSNNYSIISLITCSVLSIIIYYFLKPKKIWIIPIFSLILSILYLIYFR